MFQVLVTAVGRRTLGVSWAGEALAVPGKQLSSSHITRVVTQHLWLQGQAGVGILQQIVADFSTHFQRDRIL